MEETQKLFIENVLGKPPDDFMEITDEVIKDEKMVRDISSKFESVGLGKKSLSRSSWLVTVYYLIRKIRPSNIVETGVWHGLSTYYVLKALQSNGIGELTSLDYPAYAEEGGYKTYNPYLSEEERMMKLPLGKEPGWIVPDSLKNSWELIIGKSEDKLLEILRNKKNLDIFLHDSEHSYKNMMFEFEIAHEHLCHKGLLLADNIHWNSSFKDFCKRENLIPITYLAYLEDPNNKHPFGGIVKT